MTAEVRLAAGRVRIQGCQLALAAMRYNETVTGCRLVGYR